MARDLYTDQVHLKRLLQGQATPAFTKLDSVAKRLVDPALVPGMGAIKEDPESGKLYCPVRGCGKLVTHLARHASIVHRNIGGAAAIREALDIPKKVALLSERGRDSLRVVGRSAEHMATARSKVKPDNMRRASSWGRKSLMADNFADTCPAQMAAKMSALRKKLGRKPRAAEFRQEYGGEMLEAARRVFGEWDSITRACEPTDRAWLQRPAGRKWVIDILKSFHEANGDLPKSNEKEWPWTPPYADVLLALGVDNWPAAMRSVVEELGITSERYGRPTQGRA